MKLSDFQRLTADQLYSLDYNSLKSLVSEQGKKLNKRIDRISSSSATSKASVNLVKASGGRFGVKGKKTKISLVNEAIREQRFNANRTSTFRGAVAVKENIAKSTAGMTSKEFRKSKENEYSEKREAELKSKSKTGKLTKSQKKSINKGAKKIGKVAEKAFNDQIGKAWNEWKKYKEKNPAITVKGTYSKEGVKQAVVSYAIEKAEGVKRVKKGLKTSFNEITNYIEKKNDKEDKQDAEVWNTVDSDTPFDQDIKPEKVMKVLS